MEAKTAPYYDKIYAALGKDYAAESERLKGIVKQHKRSRGKALLDVACGTGAHAEHLCKAFGITGLDIEPAMVTIAQERCPTGVFFIGDMREFDLDRSFDVVTCLFSSIGFMKTVEDLRAATGEMARHLVPGGVLLIEPWLAPDTFSAGHMQVVVVDEEELKLARVTRSDRDGDLSILDMQYLIATAEGIEHVAERYEMGLFEREEYGAALEEAGLDVVYDRQGPAERGLFIATKALD